MLFPISMTGLINSRNLTKCLIIVLLEPLKLPFLQVTKPDLANSVSSPILVFTYISPILRRKRPISRELGAVIQLIQITKP